MFPEKWQRALMRDGWGGDDQPGVGGKGGRPRRRKTTPPRACSLGGWSAVVYAMVADLVRWILCFPQ